MVERGCWILYLRKTEELLGRQKVIRCVFVRLCVHTNNQLPLCGHKKIISKDRDAGGEREALKQIQGSQAGPHCGDLDENGPHMCVFGP